MSENMQQEFPAYYTALCARVADAILLTNIYWLPFSAVKGTEEGFRAQAWALLYPLLTQRGREVFTTLAIPLTH